MRLGKRFWLRLTHMQLDEKSAALEPLKCRSLLSECSGSPLHCSPNRRCDRPTYPGFDEPTCLRKAALCTIRVDRVDVAILNGHGVS